MAGLRLDPVTPIPVTRPTTRPNTATAANTPNQWTQNMNINTPPRELTPAWLYSFLWDRALRNRPVTYGEIAEHADIKWSKFRYPLFSNLDTVLKMCAERNTPPVTVIVVSMADLRRGYMTTESSVNGFCNAAHSLGFEGAPSQDSAMARKLAYVRETTSQVYSHAKVMSGA